MNFRYQENLMAAREANGSPRRQVVPCLSAKGWPAFVEVGIDPNTERISTLANFDNKSDYGYRKRVVG
ncbi:MAG: hypothetical protein HYR56_03595 [Acidobacteria bacterium]|nr:hypothetical protein [Acidobacteriota bacterium]MBI3427014.1 hypothetical protein [Acidobacteriota bacterium]